MKEPFVFCHMCDFYSESHDACFHPDAWGPGHQSFPGKKPGNCLILNSDYHCQWYEPIPKVSPVVQPTGRGSLSFRFRKFLRRLRGKK